MPSLNAHRAEITSLAARYRLPAVYPFRFFTELGGLLSYGNDLVDNFRRAATYADRILKGAKPSELPVQAPVKFELVINLKTAKALGLDVPLHAPAARRRGDRMMKRREFITLLGGAAAAWPLAARAQQRERCGASACCCRSRGRSGISGLVAAFLQGLAAIGLDHRPQRADRLPLGRGPMLTDIRRHAAELVALAPDVILAHGSSTVRPLLQATRTIPIVFTQRHRSSRRRLRRKPGAAGRQRHRFHADEYSMAGNGWSCSRRSRRA